MTIDRDALQLSAEKKLAAIGAINEDQSNRVGGPWVNAPLEAVLDAILPEVQADAYDEGVARAEDRRGCVCTSPTHRREYPALHWRNPYRKAASE